MVNERSFRSRLMAGDELLGTWLTLGSAPMAEAVAHCGLDWVVIDAEHAPNAPRDVADQLRAVDAARSWGSHTESVVRVSANDPIQIKQVMDVGASAVMVPNISSAAEAAAAISAMHHPGGDEIDRIEGIRGVAGLVRAARYGMDRDFLRTANQGVLSILQIESAAGVREAAGIVSTRGLGCIFIGPSDLAASMDHLGDPWHKDVVDAIQATIRAARAAHVPVGIFASDAVTAKTYRSWGVRMIGLHSDVRWLTGGIIQEMAKMLD